MVYPKGEQVWVSYYNSFHELLFIITSKQNRDYYYIYEFDGETFHKLGKAKSPIDLEEKFEVNSKIFL